LGSPLEIIDLSIPIRSLHSPTYPGQPKPVKAALATITSDGYATNLWVLDEHTATHVDVPAHFIKGGDSVDAVPPERFVGWGIVADLTDLPPKHVVSANELRSRITYSNTRRKPTVLLLRTGYGRYAGTGEWFNHPVLGSDACRYVVKAGFKALGTDAPSPDQEPYVAHKILLPSGIVIFENLTNLDLLVGREFLFVGAPLKLVGGTASPVRALAIIMS